MIERERENEIEREGEITRNKARFRGKIVSFDVFDFLAVVQILLTLRNENVVKGNLILFDCWYANSSSVFLEPIALQLKFLKFNQPSYLNFRKY